MKSARLDAVADLDRLKKHLPALRETADLISGELG
jgi:hypothetical protein